MRYRKFVTRENNPYSRVGEYWIVHDDLDGAVKARLVQVGKNTYRLHADSSIEIPFSTIRPFVLEVAHDPNEEVIFQ